MFLARSPSFQCKSWQAFRNPYGHPTAEALDRLHTHGVQVWRRQRTIDSLSHRAAESSSVGRLEVGENSDIAVRRRISTRYPGRFGRGLSLTVPRGLPDAASTE